MGWREGMEAKEVLEWATGNSLTTGTFLWRHSGPIEQCPWTRRREVIQWMWHSQRGRGTASRVYDWIWRERSLSFKRKDLMEGVAGNNGRYERSQHCHRRGPSYTWMASLTINYSYNKQLDITSDSFITSIHLWLRSHLPPWSTALDGDTPHVL